MDTIELIARNSGRLAIDEEINNNNCWTVWSPSFREYLSHLYSEQYLANNSKFRGDDLYYTSLHTKHTEKDSEGNGCFDKSYNLLR